MGSLKKNLLSSTTAAAPDLQQLAVIPLKDMEKSNPVVISHRFNPAMGKWDIDVMIGNFKSEAEALEACLILAQMCERELGVSFGNHKAALS